MVSPPQTAWSATGLTVGTGLTVMLRVCASPWQEPNVGVTVISAVWTDVPVAVPLKFKILELPFAGSPILGLLFVQVNCEPMVAVKATAIFSPAHLLTSPGLVNTGTGSIVTVKFRGAPTQPLLVGVTTKLLVCPTVEGTVGTEIFPEPEADIPVSVLLFVQLYVVVDKLPLNVKLMGVPPHIF